MGCSDGLLLTRYRTSVFHEISLFVDQLRRCKLFIGLLIGGDVSWVGLAQTVVRFYLCGDLTS